MKILDVFKIRFQIFRGQSQICPKDSNLMMTQEIEEKFEVLWNSFESAVEWIIFGFQVVILFFTQCKFIQKITLSWIMSYY